MYTYILFIYEQFRKPLSQSLFSATNCYTVEAERNLQQMSGTSDSSGSRCPQPYPHHERNPDKRKIREDPRDKCPACLWLKGPARSEGCISIDDNHDTDMILWESSVRVMTGCLETQERQSTSIQEICDSGNLE